MLYQKIFALALSVLFTATSSFVPADDYSKSRLTWNLHASDPTSADAAAATVQDEQRRNLMISSALAMVGASSALVLNKDFVLEGAVTKQAAVGSAAVSRQLMVDQALEIIENQCDRRFLHAVVASDYRLLYQQMAAPLDNQLQVSVLRTDQDVSVLKSSILSSGDLDVIDAKLKDRPMKVDASCQLAFANPKDVATDEDHIVSIWPLGEQVHFTWMEDKTSLASIGVDDKIIVDGIDCGRMSLEDALEEGKQVLLRSETYLAVPRSLEKELIAKLQNAFLI
ncbi:unnamed protein product [Cylindrotheca closterium]|uniref:Uncharacterized protein n=1 Tax=Cylindrotheca closterium TaxID=2856 RepID=A0AAD2PVC6_9STRA|nr:unnamed protein product [Cylindrotheca closterium]